MADIAMPTLVEEEVKNDFPRMGVIAALVNIQVRAKSEYRKERRGGRFRS